MHIERNIVFWSAALAVFVGLLWLLSPILLPFVLGMAIAYLLDPLNRRLTKRGMSRALASFIILAGFVLAFVLLLAFDYAAAGAAAFCPSSTMRRLTRSVCRRW